MGGNPTFIKHLAVTVALVDLLAVHEILIGHVHGGGHHGSRINLGAFTKRHPVGVDDDHLPVGANRAINLRGGRTRHPIQCHGLGIGLIKVNLRISSHIKTLPIHHRAL